MIWNDIKALILEVKEMDIFEFVHHRKAYSKKPLEDSHNPKKVSWLIMIWKIGRQRRSDSYLFLTLKVLKIVWNYQFLSLLPFQYFLFSHKSYIPQFRLEHWSNSSVNTLISKKLGNKKYMHMMTFPISITLF